MLGSYYVQARTVDLRVFLLALPISFLVAAILNANNLRDVDADRLLGKRTLVTLIGRTWGRRGYYLMLFSAYASLLALVLLGFAPIWLLLAFATVPLALNNAQRAGPNAEPRTLSLVTRRTADLHARFGQMMILGFVLAMAIARLL